MQRVLNTPVPAPGVDNQLQVLALAADLRNLTSHIDILWRRIWSGPEQADDIRRELNAVGGKDTFESWLATLPFPLASVLWTYHAVIDRKTKLDCLFRFFEALAQFNVTLILSALASNTKLSEYRRGLTDEHLNVDTFQIPSMWSWVNLGSRLAKFMRQKLNEKESKTTLLSAFGDLPQDSAEMLSDPDMWEILDEVREKRNEWLGHSGVEGAQERDRRIEYLETYLSKIRKIVSNRYEPLMVVTRGPETDFRSSLHYYDASHLRGHSMTPLPEVHLAVHTTMESDALYMVCRNGTSAVKILPFIIIRKDTATERIACYFYNRMKEGKARFVSHHFEEESEILLESEAVRPCFDALEVNPQKVVE